MNYDLIIIGAGPIGLACGIEAKKNKLSYLIIEKGCIVNSVFHYPTNMTFFSTSEKIELGDVPFVSHGVKPTRREALEYYRRVANAYDLNIHTYEIVESVEKNKNLFSIRTSKAEYTSEFVIASTGYFDNPNLMNIPGEELPKVMHYFDEAHPYSSLDVAVIGGGNSAVDVALETYRTGANVTMIVREPELKPSIKYWVKPDIENRIKEGSIRSYFNSTVKEIKEKEIIIDSPAGEINLKNDFIFAMTGYHPDFSFLKNIGVKFDEDELPIINIENYESNVNGLYLSGVVCGGRKTDKWFIENSIAHAKVIMKDIMRKLK
jgi:thioredoxin reductase (NADPH)